MRLGNRIKIIREQKGISGADFCHGIVSPSHLSNIENNRYKPSYDTILLMADRLEVPRDYFLKIDEEDYELTILLSDLENLLENGETKRVTHFLNENASRFNFISSLKQEFQFELARFYFYINTDQLIEAKRLYKEKISWFEVDSNLLNVSLLEKYNHVSGLYYYYIGDYLESLDYFKTILKTNKGLDLTARVSFNIALNLIQLHRYREALGYAKKANQIYLQQHTWLKTGDTYNLMAYLYREIGKLDKAELMVSKGFDIIGTGSEILQARLYHNLALIYKDKKLLEEAIINIEKSIHLKQKNNNVDIFISYNLKHTILLEQENLIDLMKSLDESVKYIKTNKEKALYLFIQSKAYFLLSDVEAYESKIKKSISLFRSDKDWKFTYHASDHYSNFLESKNKYKNALYYQKLALHSLLNIYQEEVT